MKIIKIIKIMCFFSVFALKANQISVSQEDYSGDPNVECQKQGEGINGRVLWSPECDGGTYYYIDCGT